MSTSKSTDTTLRSIIQLFLRQQETSTGLYYRLMKILRSLVPDSQSIPDLCTELLHLEYIRFRLVANPGFWPGGPSRVVTPEGGGEPLKLLKIGGFP